MKEGVEKHEQIPMKPSVFLEKLKGGESIPNDSSIAVVVAHQDDESIAFGAQIPRFPGCLMVHVTDGAPANPKAWKQKGFEAQEQYVRVRGREADIALDIAGHTGERISLHVTDQQAAFQLAENAQRLAALFKKHGTQFVLTHSYEGGHPDHDAVAFAVHAAKEILKKEKANINIIEAPLYRMQGSESVRQSFVPSVGVETVEIPLTSEQRHLKSVLFDAHRSQQEVFNQNQESKRLSTTTEWLREAPTYDFAALPNQGMLSHIYGDAGINQENWSALTDAALTTLEIKKSGI